MTCSNEPNIQEQTVKECGVIVCHNHIMCFYVYALKCSISRSSHSSYSSLYWVNEIKDASSKPLRFTPFHSVKNYFPATIYFLTFAFFPTNVSRPQASYSQPPLIVHSDVFPSWCSPTSCCQLHHSPPHLGPDTLLLPTVDSWSQKNSVQPGARPPSSSPNPRKMASNQGNTHGAR